MGKNKRSLLIILLISLVFSSFFYFLLPHPVKPDDDTGQYDTIGWNIAQGNGFSLSGSQPFAPIMLREPLYPYFLGTIYKIFGHNHTMVIIFQIALFCLTCLIVYSIAKEIFDERAARYSALLTALCPTLANYTSYMLTETIFTFLVSLFILVLIKAIKSENYNLFMLSGVVLGLSVLCKAIMLPFVIISVIIILLKRRIMPALLFTIIFLSILSPWLYRNHALFNTYQLSLRGGAALWERAQKSNDTLEDMKHAVIFNFSEYLGNKMFPGLAENPRDFILQGSKRSHDKEEELMKHGMTRLEIDRLMKKEAKEIISKHPLKFILYIPVELIKMSAFIYVPSLNEPETIYVFNGFKNGKAILSSIRSIFRLSAYPILILAAMGVFFERRSWKAWVLIAAPIIYINLIYSMLFAMGRYAVPLIPYYLIFAVKGFLNCL